jgi:hypothetical protein
LIDGEVAYAAGAFGYWAKNAPKLISTQKTRQQPRL